MRSPRPLALGLLLVSAFVGVATGTASAGDLTTTKSDTGAPSPVELILTEQGSETPWLNVGDQVTLLVPDLNQATVAEVPDGLFVEQSGKEVPVEPGGSTYTVGDVPEGSYTVVVAKLVKVPLIGTINVSSTKPPR